MRKFHPFRVRAANCGIIIALCIQSLVQDYYGRDAWVERVRTSSWFDAAWSVPIALFFLVCAFLVLIFDEPE